MRNSYTLYLISKTTIIVSVLFLISFFCFVKTTEASLGDGIGFVPGVVWLSNDNPSSGETVTLHTVLYNGSTGMLSGTVTFFDKDLVLGSRNVSLEKETIEGVSLPWVATPGSHSFSVSLSNAKISNKIGSPSLITPEYQTAKVSKSVVVSPKKEILAQADSADEKSNSSPDYLDNVDALQGKVESVLGENTSAFFKDTAQTIDDFREEKALYFKSQKEEASSLLDANSVAKDLVDIAIPKENNEDTQTEVSGDDRPKSPWLYVKMFLYGIITFIFTTPIVFYALSVFLIFLVLKTIFRAIRRKRE